MVKASISLKPFLLKLLLLFIFCSSTFYLCALLRTTFYGLEALLLKLLLFAIMIILGPGQHQWSTNRTLRRYVKGRSPVTAPLFSKI